MLEDLDPQARGADWFSAQTEAARLRLVQVVAKNPFFSHAFDPNSERDYSKLSVDEDQEYKDFVLGVCRRLTASTFESLYMLLNSAPPHSCCSRLMQP